ncbi:MAG: hypothetical protein PHC64_07435 [Candidatus Gastranaerophilales bacterium]|nr:hypothetical protein [Candidatus Gastranaerophilales bacterium]
MHTDRDTPHPVFSLSQTSAQVENRPLPQGERENHALLNKTVQLFSPSAKTCVVGQVCLTYLSPLTF